MSVLRRLALTDATMTQPRTGAYFLSLPSALVAAQELGHVSRSGSARCQVPARR